jgi:hypothetical protein
MRSLAIHAAVLTGLGALVLMGTVASTVPAAARCVVDEGNGRYTPCDALYKSKKCFIDEGNGRYTPCEALVKRKKSKKKDKPAEAWRFQPCQPLG